jgi:UDP-N-acetyl-D-galactosamine dehydrogenase
MDAVIFAVSHNEFLSLSKENLAGFFKKNLPNNKKTIIDVKGIFSRSEIESDGYKYWRF